MSFVSDMDLAALEFDVKAAQDVLAMFADAGKLRIRVQDLLQQCMARIDNWLENGFIIFAGLTVSLKGTYKFWTELKWLLRW
ncbi:MAG: hypothetical protein IJ654_05490 [Bacteroidales bacterium]|nr:hypothetical protein [Bacteroidales bacterium]